MGSGRIVENMGNGKYKVRLDKATDKVNAELEKKRTHRNNIQNVLIPAAEDANEAAITEYNNQKLIFDALIIELNNLRLFGSQGDVAAKLAEIRTKTSAIIKAASDKESSLKKLQTLNLQKLAADKEIEMLDALIKEAEADIREVWAVDYTVNIANNTRVGTVEINGEATKRPTNPATGLPDTTIPEKVQIVAGGGEGKGIITPKPIMNGKEFYTSETFKPGWQKWKPTFRAATITSIDYSKNLCNVTLDPAQSSVIKKKEVKDEFGRVVTPAEGFDINQTEKLEKVPIDYMTCKSSAFVVGDKVVIEFIDQVWTNPVVKGFIESPRACHMQVKIRLKTATVKQDFVDFCLARQTQWERFRSLLNDFYSPGPPASGIVVDMINWHQASVGNWITALYGVQNE